MHRCVVERKGFCRIGSSYTQHAFHVEPFDKLPMPDQHGGARIFVQPPATAVARQLRPLVEAVGEPSELLRPALKVPEEPGLLSRGKEKVALPSRGQKERPLCQPAAHIEEEHA